MQLSARNQLKGLVRSVLVGAVMAEVAALIGDQEVVAAIDAWFGGESGPQGGDEVTVIIKATDVMIATGT